jgi:hypothetical protein
VAGRKVQRAADRHHQRGGQKMRGLCQRQRRPVQVGPAIAHRGQRPLHRRPQIVRRVGKRPQPGQVRVNRGHDPGKIAVIGARLQRLGPPRGDGKLWLPEGAQIRQPGSIQRLDGRHQCGPAGSRQNDRHAHAQITFGAGQAFGGGKREAHGSSSYLSGDEIETLPGPSTRPREISVAYLAGSVNGAHLTREDARTG